MSRGRLARFVAGGLRVYFAWINAFFAFILLTLGAYTQYWCGCVVPFTLCGCLVLVCHHPKNCKRRELWLNVVSCKQWGAWEAEVSTMSFVDISYHPAFIATHRPSINIPVHHRKYNYNYKVCYAAKSVKRINERCL